MPIRDYPFIEIAKGGTPVLQTARSGPRLWIRVINPRTGLGTDTPAIVDTGADDCLFPAEWAIKLGYNLAASPYPPLQIHTANGATYAYIHETTVAVLGVLADGRADKNTILYPAHNIFIRYTDGLSQFLLGQASFLHRFVPSINYPQKKFSIRLPQSPKVVLPKRRHIRRASN